MKRETVESPAESAIKPTAGKISMFFVREYGIPPLPLDSKLLSPGFQFVLHMLSSKTVASYFAEPGEG